MNRARAFFLRFRRRAGRGLFAAFWLLGLQRDQPAVEERSWLFLLRLAAFALILMSIAIKNRAGRSEAAP